METLGNVSKILKDLKVSEDIIEKFKGEKVDEKSLLLLRRTKMKAKGQLYDRYNNRISKLGTLLPKPKRFKSIQHKAPSDTLILNSISDDVRQLCEELKYNRDDTEIATILSKWSYTTEYRSKWISNCVNDKNVESIIQEWPAYTQAYGPRLIDIDFQYLYPEADNVYIKFDKFCNNVLPIMESKIIEPVCKQMLKEFKLQKNITPDAKTCITLLLLHAVLKPTNKKQMRGLKRLKDSQNSFMVLLSSANDVDCYISNQLNIKGLEKKQLQPFIFIIGKNMYSSNQFFIYWDNIKYKFVSALAAVDCAFKLFQVFNLKYPKECEAVWQFIQQFLYKITTSFDDAFPSISLLIKKLENSVVRS